MLVKFQVIIISLKILISDQYLLVSQAARPLVFSASCYPITVNRLNMLTFHFLSKVRMEQFLHLHYQDHSLNLGLIKYFNTTTIQPLCFESMTPKR